LSSQHGNGEEDVAKFKVAKVAAKEKARLRGGRVKTKHIAGRRVILVDSNDDNFEDDLTRAFIRNIKQVRQANTAMFGSPDGPPTLQKVHRKPK